MRSVCLCVIVGFVDDKGKMQQRVIKLGLYNEAPEEKLTNQMSDHILHEISEVLEAPPKSLKVFTRDGVYLNELCMLKLTGGLLINPNTNKEVLMRGIYPEAVNIKCMSHTLDNCGADYTVGGIKHNRIEGPAAKMIYNQINGLFSSPGESVKLSWKNYAGTAMPSVSQTRWWSREEFWAYLLPYFKFDEEMIREEWFDNWIQERVESLRSGKKSVGALLMKLESTFVPGTRGYDIEFLVKAFIEIAVVVDITEKVRQATYVIEGDGPIAVMVMEVLDSVARYYKSTYQEMEFSNVRRYIAQAVRLNVAPPGYVLPAIILDEFATGPRLPEDIQPILDEQHIQDEQLLQDALPPQDIQDNLPVSPARAANPDAGANDVVAWELDLAWKEYCLKLSEPYMTYFNEMVMGHNCLPLWRAASMADPLNMQRQTLTAGDLRVRIQPLIGNLVPRPLVDRMVAELSEYERACSNLDWSNETYARRLLNVEEFWSKHKLLPAWTEFAHLVFLLQPTSACVERSFSMLKYIMGDQQTRSLRDKIEASLMLRYNRGS